FYRAVLRRALGYFGSKLLNHKRTCRKEADFRQIVEEGRGKRLTTEWKRELRRIAAYVCEHRERERRFLAEGAWPVLHNLHRLAPGVRLGLAQALGYLLGDRLHDALVLGAVQKEELRELFLRRFERPGEPLAEYLYLVRRLRHVREFYKSRRERM
ncbi:MAG: hypothetical protein HYZ53_02065, partial [Planctomycetes bacterium]|nr:hypothetical protein [Planctomycetota bacterium]